MELNTPDFGREHAQSGRFGAGSGPQPSREARSLNKG